MDLSVIEGVLREVKNYHCEVDTITEGELYKLNFEHQPEKRIYLVKFFEVDGAGTLGLQIRWRWGTVYDEIEAGNCLVLNATKLLDIGPLYGGILPRKDGSPVFLFVGQMIFPPNTVPKEVATLFFNNAFLNYALFDIKVPGVEMHE